MRSTVGGRWHRILATAAAGAIVVLGLTFLFPRVYRAQTTVVPSSAITGQGELSFAGSLAGAAAQLGFGPGMAGTTASGLFAPILRSRTLGERLLRAEFTDRHARSVLLIDQLADARQDTAARLDEALQNLNRDVLKLRFDAASGVTTVAVELRDPVLAAGVANMAVAEMDAVNREARSSQAKQWVSFATGRVAEAATELEKAERALESFRMSNRSTIDSPRLGFEEARLTRDLEIARQGFLAARGQLDAARSEAAKTVPVITVLDRAVAPAKAHRPRRVFLTISAFVLLLGFATALELARSFARGAHETSLPAPADRDEQ